MSFWQDARPAVPRFRRPPHRPPPPRWRRVAVVAIVLATVGSATLLLAPDPAAPTRRARPPAEAGAARSRDQVRSVWSRSLPDEPGVLLADGHRGAVVVGRETVSAFTATGRLRWRAATAELAQEGAVGGDTVLVVEPDAFVALDRATGARRWAVGTPETPGPVAVVAPPGTPAIAVVSTAEGGLAGLDAATGRARWSVRLTGYLRGSPVADGVTGTMAAVWQETDATWLRVVDAASGALRFERPLENWAGSPAIGGDASGRVDGSAGVVVIGSGSGHYDATVQAFDLGDGSLRWQARADASFHPGHAAVVDREAVVVVDQLGTVSAYDLATGRRRWRTRTGTAMLGTRPVVAGGAVQVANPVGEVLSFDRRTGALRARRRSAGFPIGLVAARGRVVVAQRLVRSHGLQAFSAGALAAPAGVPE